MSFFEKHYPDSIGLIGREKLCRDYFSTEPSMLISIKASNRQRSAGQRDSIWVV